MKKIKIALALSLISAFAVSCQKESIQDSQTPVEVQPPAAAICVTYWIDDVPNHAILHNRAELSDLISRLTSLAALGHRIRISNGDTASIGNLAKDVVEFSSNDPKVFNEWVSKMNKDGYEVDYYYDDKTGVYHGIAVKE